MKKLFLFLFCLALFCSFIPFNFISAYAEEDIIYLGGMPAGFSLDTVGAYVLGTCDVLTDSGIVSPSKESGICANDNIISIDGVKVNTAIDIEKCLNNANKKIIEIERNNQTIFLSVVPAKDINGKLKLGVFIKDDLSGIGTITYFKNNRFASLGHPVIDDNGNILKINGGKLFNCSINGYVKGEKNKAGELHGIFLNKNIGSIDKNLYCGVFGELNSGYDTSALKRIDIGDAKPGKASIFSTIEGESPLEYEISIIKVENENKINKNYVVKITDKRLLSSTCGIIQGMSGSPIVQEGKLVGAITHVFINDPTRGFGISVKNMINN